MSYSRLFGDRAITSSLTYADVRPILRWVYAWMAFGLLVTAAVSLFTFRTVSAGLDLSLSTQASALALQARISQLSGPMMIALIAELVLVIALSWALPRISPTVAALMFVGYAALNGFTLSLVLFAYETTSIGGAFLTTAGLFAAMTVVGFTTEIDLTRFRGYFLMGLIGLLIAMVVNAFVQSGPFGFIINLVGVVLFVGLTAYDTQRIKRLAADPEVQQDPSLAAKISIFGALQLYLDFVNLFLFLLRLMGRRR